jgi:hypothetical protein
LSVQSDVHQVLLDHRQLERGCDDVGQAAKLPAVNGSERPWAGASSIELFATLLTAAPHVQRLLEHANRIVE